MVPRPGLGGPSRAAAEDVLVEELGERVLLSPVLERGGFEPAKDRTAIAALDNHDFLRLEQVEKRGRLRRKEYLRTIADRTNRLDQEVERRGMKSQFRLVDTDELRQSMRGLMESSQERQEAKRAIGEVSGAEDLVSLIDPVETHPHRVATGVLANHVGDHRRPMCTHRCRDQTLDERSDPTEKRLYPREGSSVIAVLTSLQGE
jgi:hypothetical protein